MLMFDFHMLKTFPFTSLIIEQIWSITKQIWNWSNFNDIQFWSFNVQFRTSILYAEPEPIHNNKVLALRTETSKFGLFFFCTNSRCHSVENFSAYWRFAMTMLFSLLSVKHLAHFGVQILFTFRVLSLTLFVLLWKTKNPFENVIFR